MASTVLCIYRPSKGRSIHLKATGAVEVHDPGDRLKTLPARLNWATFDGTKFSLTRVGYKNLKKRLAHPEEFWIPRLKYVTRLVKEYEDANTAQLAKDKEIAAAHLAVAAARANLAAVRMRLSRLLTSAEIGF